MENGGKPFAPRWVGDEGKLRSRQIMRFFVVFVFVKFFFFGGEKYMHD